MYIAFAFIFPFSASTTGLTVAPRPVVRPGNQRTRLQANPFVFPPQTPPDSAKLDPLPRPASSDWDQSVYGSPTLRSEPTPPLPDVTADDAAAKHRSNKPLPRPPTHGRSHSFSTADEHTVTSVSNEPGTFKVVIERPPFGRPKTADTGTFPLLEVPIPHYRLGTPRFSTHGAVDLRSSVYTGASATDDLASVLMTPPRATTHSFLSSRPRSDAYSPIPYRYRAAMDRPPLPPSAPSSSRVSQSPIGPGIYDALTLNPDDRAVVRFSPAGDILAATPSRLVAHITSPSFLDYELLSDFFLTFRAFLCPRDLVAYLISRLRWAVDRKDDFGRIVRVRTFVALRHWILNYFVDDFVPAYKLRTYFCELVNSLHDSLRTREDGGGGDIKIVGELKKCWRRTCAQYWETDDSISQNSGDGELLPGGQAGSQDSLDEIRNITAPPTSPRRPSARDTKETIGSNPSDHFASRHMEWAQKTRHTPQNSISLPHVSSPEYDVLPIPLTPASEQSMHVLSCSIPMRGLGKPDQSVELAMCPHPVSASNTRLAPVPQQITSPKGANRPSHSHKRSGSFSDALRDSRAPLSIPKTTPAEISISAVTNIPGSLVRGGLFQPGTPYFEVKSLRHTRSQNVREAEDTLANETQRMGHSTSPGMKKIFGTVRRALSVRQPLNATSQLGGITQQRSAQSVRSSNPAVVSSAFVGDQRRTPPRPRIQVRVDLLAASVEESFREATREQLEYERRPSRREEPPDLGGFEFEFEKDGKAASKKRPKPKPVSSNITIGSKSILIIDDTGPPPLPMMSGALPIESEAADINEKSQTQDQTTAIMSEQAFENTTSPTQHSNFYNLPHPAGVEQQRDSRDTVQRVPTRHRRSMSEGREQMHSFKRRGSNKTSIARTGSLRRHASHNSGLSRMRDSASIATFQTVSSDNDPFFLDQPSTGKAAGPPRQLRRRPGGDLRAADNIHDLELSQRPHSTGSVSNRTHSIANSVVLRSDRGPDPATETSHQVEDLVSPGQVKKPISLVATHSSQPNLRPSFELEVAKLAALPDDSEDDGGIESALMKLEGRFEKKSPSIPSQGSDPDLLANQSNMHVLHQISSNATATPGTEHHTAANGEAMNQHSENPQRRVPADRSVAESTDSYSSIPLLDRGISEVTASTQAHTLDTMRSSAKPSPLNLIVASPRTITAPGPSSSANSSGEFVTETESLKRIRTDGLRPLIPTPRESFLLDEDEDLSDMDFLAAASRRTSHGVRSFFDDEMITPDHEKDHLPMHPMRHPPTPPLTAHRLNDPLPNPTLFDRAPPTPGLTPTASGLNHQIYGHPRRHVDSPMEYQELQQDKRPAPIDHLPFVLAYDSELIAQQMTIVEKDALDEIDWKELVELRWKQSSPQIRDWVQYLRTQEVRGVDVVIARFNLVVKWVVSECVLTENIEERVRCIVKYIHIATQARRLRNYATMYQIAIALISNDISRLKKTWSMVPASDLQTMKELEALVQPLRNFYNLRLEMETSTVEEGCIPFIGIYTRDLIYNAQKPAFIDAPPVEGERLVNFERHHTAATIVKNLLRLLEASSKYNLKVEPTLLGKCLWMAALSDDEITRRSRLCE